MDISTSSAAPAAAASTTAAPAVTATPAAAATTATTTTPAVDTSTSTSTSTSTASPVAPKSGESDSQFLERLLNGDTTGDTTGEDDESSETDDEQTIRQALEGALNEDGTEKETSEETSEETKTATPEETSSAEDEFDPYGVLPEIVTPKDLQGKIDASPELQAALDADPALKDSLFASARAAAETAQFKELFSTAEEAKTAAEGNRAFSELADLVSGINDPKDAQGFYGRLMQMSTLLDDAGQPILDANGNPQSDGTVGRLIHHTGALFLNHFEQLAQKSSDPELTAAVEILKAKAFGAPEQTGGEDLTEAQRTRQADLDAREAKMRESETAAQNAKKAAFEDRIVADIDTYADTEIGKLLGRTDLSAEARKDLAVKIRAAAYELTVNNPSFQREQDVLLRRQLGPQTQKDRTALGQKWLNTTLPKIAPKMIAEAGSRIVARQAQQKQTQAAKVDASRSEGAGTLRTSKAAPANARQVQDQTVQALTAKLGRAPRTEEILASLLNG